MSIIYISITNFDSHKNEKYADLKFEVCTNRGIFYIVIFFVMAPLYTLSVHKVTMCIEYPVSVISFGKNFPMCLTFREFLTWL